MIRPVFREKNMCCLFVLAVSCVLVFLFYGLFVPVKLTVVRMPSPYYGDIRLNEQNTDVRKVSLFGVSFPASDVYAKQSPDGTIEVWSKNLSCKYKSDILLPERTKVTYDGAGAYAGQPLDSKKICVKAVYGDEKRDVSWFQVSDEPVPLVHKVSVPVKLVYDTISVNIPVIEPKEIVAEYSKTCHMGDVFDRDAIKVRMLYPDGTESVISDFLLPDAPKYVSDETSVTVVTDYGTTHLSVVPKDAKKLTVSYDEPLYVGDKVLPLHIRMMLGNKKIDFSDFTSVDDVGILKTHAEIEVSSKYGTSVLAVDPIDIKSCEPIVDGDVIENKPLKLNGIKLIYEDETSVQLQPEEYQVTSKIDKMKSGTSRIWFTYQGIRLCFDVDAMPKAVLSIRDSDVDLPENVLTYDLSEEELKTISVLCQRLASNDLHLVAAEASLLANRFEMYGAGNLVDYLFTSGFWGSDASDYVQGRSPSDTAFLVVKDVLVNGYRTLPLYVDERKTVLSADSFQMGDLITKDDDVVYGFYSCVSRKSSVAYGYTQKALSLYKGTDVPVWKEKKKNDKDEPTGSGISFE